MDPSYKDVENNTQEWLSMVLIDMVKESTFIYDNNYPDHNDEWLIEGAFEAMAINIESPFFTEISGNIEITGTKLFFVSLCKKGKIFITIYNYYEYFNFLYMQ